MPQDGLNGRTDAPDRRAPFRDTLRGRLLLGALAAIAPLLIGAGLWILVLSHSTENYRQVANAAARETQTSVRLLQHLNHAEDAGIDYIRSGTADDRRIFRREARKVDRGLTGTGGYDRSFEVIAFVSIRRPWALAKREVAAYRPGRQVGEAFEGHVHAAAAGLQRLMAGTQHHVARDLATTERAARLNWLLGLSAVAVALLLAALLASRLSKSLVRPLEQLARAARSLAAGHLGHRVEISSTPS
jgi:HAMP domain-containing protein